MCPATLRAALAALVLTSAARAQVLPAAPVPVVPLPTTPVPVVSPPPAPIVPQVGVEAAGCPCLCGENGSQFAIDLMLGMQTGVRGQAAVVRTEQNAFVVEAFYGLLLNKFDASEGAGVGGRYYWRRTDRAGCNSVIFGPGVGAYYHFDEKVWMLAPTVDVAWVRAIGDNGAWQIGLNAGLGVALTSDNKDDVGKVTPLFTLFTGFRF